jgi:hypothetical protein
MRIAELNDVENVEVQGRAATPAARQKPILPESSFDMPILQRADVFCHDVFWEALCI